MTKRKKSPSSSSVMSTSTSPSSEHTSPHCVKGFPLEGNVDDYDDSDCDHNDRDHDASGASATLPPWSMHNPRDCTDDGDATATASASSFVAATTTSAFAAASPAGSALLGTSSTVPSAAVAVAPAPTSLAPAYAAAAASSKSLARSEQRNEEKVVEAPLVSTRPILRAVDPATAGAATAAGAAVAGLVSSPYSDGFPKGGGKKKKKKKGSCSGSDFASIMAAMRKKTFFRPYMFASRSFRKKNKSGGQGHKRRTSDESDSMCSTVKPVPLSWDQRDLLAPEANKGDASAKQERHAVPLSGASAIAAATIAAAVTASNSSGRIADARMLPPPPLPLSGSLRVVPSFAMRQRQ